MLVLNDQVSCYGHPSVDMVTAISLYITDIQRVEFVYIVCV